jgi:uncharacterized LabA/DUF88 family protein
MRHKFEQFRKLEIAPPHFVVYIDGYNLYQAINHYEPPDLLRLGWCNYQRLAELLVEKSFACPTERRNVQVKYFTSRVEDGRTARKGEKRRQDMWLKALEKEVPSLNERTIKWGYWSPAGGRNEKKTDVNIALEIARDIIDVKPAGIVLVSGDLDFQPVVEHVRDVGVRIAVFTPDEHLLYSVGLHKDASQVRFSYLTQDLLDECRLKVDFLQYVSSKAESQPEFRPCLEYEKRPKPARLLSAGNLEASPRATPSRQK